MGNKELTLGEKRMQININSSPVELEVKQKYADLIDYLESLRNQHNGREISIAQTEAETSGLYALKAIVTADVDITKNVESDVEDSVENYVSKLIEGLRSKDTFIREEALRVIGNSAPKPYKLAMHIEVNLGERGDYLVYAYITRSGKRVINRKLI